MKKVIGIILIIAALGLGYMGINQINESSASVSIGELELSAEDEGSQTTGYIYVGLAVVSLVVGGNLLRKS